MAESELMRERERKTEYGSPIRVWKFNPQTVQPTKRPTNRKPTDMRGQREVTLQIKDRESERAKERNI